MAAINWTENLSVNIDSIDDQHKELIHLINDFYDKILEKDKQSNLIHLIDGLKSYTLYHFNKEEYLMKKLNYPYFNEHKKEHDYFVQNVNVFMDRVQSSKLIISIEITNFLKQWLINHISVTDKKYSDFFVKNGVK